MPFETDDQSRPTPDFEAQNRALRDELEAVRAANDNIQNNAFAIIDNTPDLIWSVDDQLRLMAFNQTFKEAQHRVVGREPRIGDFILYDVYNPEWLQEWEIRYRKALAGEHVEWESTYPDDHGGIRYYRITLNPIRNQSGQISGVCGMNRDISDFRSLEDQLRNEIRQRRAAEMRMQQLAYYDTLTGLPLRTKLLQILQEQIDSGERKFSHVSLVDIDRFRDINQSLGYEIGDAFLREAARRIQMNVERHSLVFRIGIGNFLILYGGPHDKVDECAGHILTSMRTVFAVENVYLYCTVSIGITLINHDIHRPNRLIQNAEIAVRLAQENGGDQVRHYSDDAHIDTAVSIQIGQDLRRAIENEEFSVVYQPTVDSQTGKWRALEALMRWHHPGIGLLMPGRFLHVAENLGLMRHIDQLIARRIRTETTDILEKTDWRIQINCSGINIDAPYIDFLIEVLEPQRFPGRFTIEITEHMLLGNSPETIRLVERMQAVGFHIALDDFGTGYSSLAYLQRLPIDYLKIDRTFVANMFTAEGAAMLHAIINLAANMHMQTIAEGVETDEQRKTLAELLCTELQGYFFQRPVPIDQLPVSLD